MGQWYQKTLSLTAAILVSISFVAAASIATDNTLEEYDPDDLYVEVYNTILGADEARQMGKKRAAWELYSQAQNLLQDIQKKYPDWNKKLIDFRLSYVKAKMEQFTEQTASDTENSPQSEIEIEVQRLLHRGNLLCNEEFTSVQQTTNQRNVKTRKTQDSAGEAPGRVRRRLHRQGRPLLGRRRGPEGRRHGPQGIRKRRAQRSSRWPVHHGGRQDHHRGRREGIRDRRPEGRG